MADLTLTGALLILQDGPRQLTIRIADDYVATIGGVPRSGEHILDLSGHVIFPGLINSYDRLDMNIFPRIKLRGTYSHAHEWHQEIEQYLRDNASTAPLLALPLPDRLFLGAVKNLLAGTTTVYHHGNFHRSLRSRRFPIYVVDRYGWFPSLYNEGNLVSTFDRTPHDAPWLIRLSEGTDDEAASELQALDEAGCLEANTILIHAIGLTESDINRIKDIGAGMIWCPGSNRYLLGQAHFHASLSGHMALGTATRLTGSLDLLEELKVAAYLSDLPARRLLQLVLRDAAHLLRLPDRGKLAHNAPADLVVLKHIGSDPYQSLVNAHRVDLRLVMAKGQPLIASPDLEPVFKLTRTPFRPIRLDGVRRLLSRDVYNRLDRIGVLETGLELL